MASLIPFHISDGNCADAMTFYQSCLGGELTITKVCDAPMKDQMPPEIHHKVVFAHLKSGARELSVTEWLHSTRKPMQGNTVGMYMNGGTYDELSAAFDKLEVGADKDLLNDLSDMSFGSYGHLADRDGAHWFLRRDAAPDA
jgi:PhnB protein